MTDFLWTTEPDGYCEPRVGEAVGASDPPRTVMQAFEDTVSKHGSRPAMGLKRPVNGVIPTDWKMWTWTEYLTDCKKFAKALVHLEVGSFKIVNILGFNSPEWFIANCGAMFAGCIAAGIYATNNTEACQYVSQHSKAEICVVDGNKQLKKYSEMKIKADLPFLKAIVVYDEPVDQALATKCGVPVYGWSDFLALGNGVSDETITTRSSGIKPGNCSTLIYTSGTTGPPKAVMISHDNVTWTIKRICEDYMDLNHTERILSYLPLSHIAAQTIDIHAPIYLGACTYFAQPDALKGTLTVSMRDVRPTIFFGVPRVWEKIQEKMVQVGRENSGLKKSLVGWAKGVAKEHSDQLQFGNSGGAPCGYGCANSIVLGKIKNILGLDAAKGCYTAAAPISVDTLNYFASLDIPVYEVFGQSECTGPHTVSFAGRWRIGYCGRPILGTQTMIVPETGELCYRGRHIFMGYMYNPESTGSTIDQQGYLHSGDVAEFDGNNDPNIPAPSGFMKITGRIKELIITAGGENIPPVLIENEMKAACVAISNCMVVGDKRKYLAMLVSLKCEVNAEDGSPTNMLAADSLFIGKEIGSSAKTVEEAMSDPLWKKCLDDTMKKGNSKTTSNAQVVQKWKMLPVDFSEKAGDLTPTLKLKRNVVTKKYAAVIDSIYGE
mmetsp:Transcript_27277/g.27510  ORF Transcript_27277/g.27510 Transcript_27277/m.27510 type:complete len:663 (-) Transcript_27277:375-2363(-)|eukprot:CAMPEP_0182416928 /NCGR_PEP_ID=MMETSP1167-20130531/1332_1 /TAXON_ID=2988 /ORGANISM="Mallomonas Sp, Strain CCMP3275" /LENGTH=662 /DNA_ID=CAMNT_0024590121 /DNA_START=67 /DNA_END=2055 /DNA_ORIENTATION=+